MKEVERAFNGLAKNSTGIDYKAVSHAFRTGLQLKEMYQTGDLKYPLANREFLLKNTNSSNWREKQKEALNKPGFFKRLFHKS